MTSSVAAVIALMSRRYPGAFADASLLETHEIAYFLQWAGERWEDFPFSDDPPLQLSADSVREAEAVLADHPTSKARVESVASLVDGYSLDILFAVHWEATHGAASLDEIVATLHQPGAPIVLQPDQIRAACAQLEKHGFLVPREG